MLSTVPIRAGLPKTMMPATQDYRAPKLANVLIGEIERLCQVLDRPIKIMEVCGGHTHAIFKYGLESLLPEAIDLIHGPGCPVCVMPRGRIDEAIALAQKPGVIFATFGDVLRVPGSQTSLLQAKACGADVRAVYSPMDALTLAVDHPDREVVFFAIGFETTAPSVAMTILEAERRGIENFSAFCNHVLVLPALEALLEIPDLSLDGFIGPGHVSTIIGWEPYGAIVDRYNRPIIISGFEPLDLLQSIWMLLSQLVEGRSEVENQYRRLVQRQGNQRAIAAMSQVFRVRDTFEWRGLGELAGSGFEIAPAYVRFDAEHKFAIERSQAKDSPACRCAEIVRGQISPWQCKVFGKACTPDTPLGACMVSSEGACAAYYKYGCNAAATQLPHLAIVR